MPAGACLNPPNDPVADPTCASCTCLHQAGTSHTELYAGHIKRSNWLFADGHVKALRPTETCLESRHLGVGYNNNAGQPCSAGSC